MITRILVAVPLLLACYALIDYASPVVFLTVAGLVAVLALREVAGICGAYGLSLQPLAYPLTIAWPWVWTMKDLGLPELIMATMLLVGSGAVLTGGDLKGAFPSAGVSLMSVFYLGLPLSVLADFQFRSDPQIWVALIAVWAGDIGAYGVGRLIGRHKITPRISPNKSLEGYVAAVVFAALAAAVIGPWLAPFRSLAFWIFAGAVTGFFGLMGDLLESTMKRGAGVKDSSSLLPGHGGILDRIDSLLLGLPAFHLVLHLVE